MKAFYTLLVAILLMPAAGISSLRADVATQVGPVKGADIRVVPQKGVLAISVKTAPSGSFVEEQCFAINEIGKRFNVYIKPDASAKDAGYTSGLFTLKDDCEKEQKWKTGSWKISIALRSSGGVVFQRATFELK
ncbi:MAG: hypothetical protein ACAI35_11020 [Candidatus Methylacidiphilales bacterium]|nr:hypothetical protein [Candidatus Methylacidiphilales bacterium]